MINRTWGEHAKNYTTDAVPLLLLLRG